MPTTEAPNGSACACAIKPRWTASRSRKAVYDGGICTRIDCVSLGVVVNREARRFYDKGEDFWPKRYAIQQPRQIGYSIIMHTLDSYNAACRVGTFDHTALDDCHTEGLTPAKTHWARPIGTAGLWRLNRRRHPLHGDAKQKPMDLGFIALLFLTSATGLVLWLARGTPALAITLCLHLGAVMALFATLPYGKFAHGVFRTASLLRFAVEKRLPNPVGLGAD